MSKAGRLQGLVAVLIVAGCLSGCKKQPSQTGSPGAAPGENMDANPSASVPQQNYPSQPGAAAAPTATATPTGSDTSASAPANVVIPARMPIRVRLAQSLNSRDSEEGQKFSGTLAAPIVVGGATDYATGTRVSGVVTEVKSPGKFKGEGVLSIRLTDVGGTAVRTASYSQVVHGKGKRTAGFIGGGTGLGAVLGGIAGGGRGAAIGAVAGAGTGAVSGSMTGNKEVELPAETVIVFRTR